MLGAHDSPGPQQGGRAPLQDPHRLQAVLTAEEGQVGIVVARLDRHGLPGLQRDVRRVADDHVDGAEQVLERVRHVAVAQVDAGPGEVAPGPREGGGVQLHGMDLGARDLVDHGPGDRPGAGAQVDDPAGPLPVPDGQRGLDRPAGEQLGLGARDEDAGADGQLDVAERGGAGQVLERLTRGPAREQGVVRRDLALPHLADHRQAPARDAEHVGQQDRGVVGGTVDPGRVQSRGGRPEQLPRPHRSSASRRAAVSASMQDSSTGPMSPSSTWSRLCDL